MNQRFAVLLATAALALAVPLAATVAEEAAKTEAKPEAKTEEAKIPAGQKLFLDKGCNSCHSLKGQGIEKKKSATATEATASNPAASPSKIPDLSAVGLEKDQAWMTKFLLKTETLHDKKHMKTWKGTQEELATLTAWLAEQKNAEAAGLKAAGDKADAAAQKADAAAQKADAAGQKAEEAKQEAGEAKEDADKAADQAKDAKEDAEKAKEQPKGK